MVTLVLKHAVTLAKRNLPIAQKSPAMKVVSVHLAMLEKVNKWKDR